MHVWRCSMKLSTSYRTIVSTERISCWVFCFPFFTPGQMPSPHTITLTESLLQVTWLAPAESKSSLWRHSVSIFPCLFLQSHGCTKTVLMLDSPYSGQCRADVISIYGNTHFGSAGTLQLYEIIAKRHWRWARHCQCCYQRNAVTVFLTHSDQNTCRVVAMYLVI